MATIQLKNVYKKYDNGFEAVKNINLNIDNKEFIIIVGPSGCGKSTTLRMIAGLEEITNGELYIDEQLMNDVEPKNRDISMVFQNYALYPHMNVYDNISFSLNSKKLSKKEIEEKVHQVAKLLELDELLDNKPTQLSGGQCQRVSIARAIVCNPKVLLMDEPLSNLDAKLRVQMRTELLKLHQQFNNTIIYVTHDQIEAMTLGSRIVVMNQGEIQQVDTPKNLYNHPNNLFVAGFIGSPQMNFIKCDVVEKDEQICLVFEDNIVMIHDDRKILLKNYIGKRVIMGIRPENLYDKENSIKEYENKIKATISVYELVGSEVYLYFELAGSKMIARVHADTNVKVGKEVEFYLDSNAIHLFDLETEKAINY